MVVVFVLPNLGIFFSMLIHMIFERGWNFNHHNCASFIHPGGRLEDVVHFEAQLERPKLSNSDSEMFLGGFGGKSKGSTPLQCRPPPYKKTTIIP